MQLCYHAYSFVDTQTGEQCRTDIRPFLTGFCNWKNSAFKNQLTYGGESVFLLPFVGEIYLFVQARDREIIKKIERSSLTVSEIRDYLDADDSIGFASYVHIGEDHVAIGSTVLAPRMAAFASHINSVLDQLRVGQTFVTRPMTSTLPRVDAQKLVHVGNFTMEVVRGNTVFESIVASLRGGDKDDLDIGSIEVTIKPTQRRGDNSLAFNAALNRAADEGLVGFDARAKMEIADKVTDIYIVGAGGIRDPIDPAREATIPEQISNAVAANNALKRCLDDFRADPGLAHVPNPGDMDLSWPPARAVDLGSD